MGARLRLLRQEAGLSVTELSAAAGLSRRHLTDAEAGRANLTVVSLMRLARALGQAPRSLLDLPATTQRVALVGLRGAGKSTVGKALALALEVPFVELDRRVEDLAGTSLAAIFDLYGAPGFRRLEAEALERVLGEGEGLVLATGGSIVAARATFARLGATCRTVWLKAPAEEHLRRVQAQGDQRPMAGRPRALEELKELLAAREADYARCEIKIDTANKKVEQVVRDLLEKLEPSS